MRIVFYGTPDFAVPSLEAVRMSDFHLVAVVTAPDKPAGRGMKPRWSAVKQWAVDHQIPVLQPENLRDDQFFQALQDLRPDLQVVVAFRFLPEKIWSLPPLGTFNLHASLLPQYRGAAPINHALINGETRTGITTFFLDKTIDTGRLLLQQTFEIQPDDNAGSLHDKLMHAGASLVLETLKNIHANTVIPRDQSAFYNADEPLKPAPKLNKEMAAIQWNAPAGSIHNLVRGLAPYPAAHTQVFLDNTCLFSTKILKTSITQRADHALPGTVDTDYKRYFYVKSADFWIEILELQPEGRKLVSIRDFLNGFGQQYHKSGQIGTLTMR